MLRCGTKDAQAAISAPAISGRTRRVQQTGMAEASELWISGIGPVADDALDRARRRPARTADGRIGGLR
jgi:hypothetical protein